MLHSDQLDRALVIAPHADDEALGCGGLMARLSSTGCRVHVLFAAVDGFHHYGLEQETTFEERLGEIDAVTGLLRCSYEIVYGNKGLIEKLDTLPRMELVDHFEQAINRQRPELLLLPAGEDYDQDHRAVFQAAFAAARPIPGACGKWLPPHVLTYEMTKLNWSINPQPQMTAFADITEYLEAKLEAVRLYRSQLRETPHIRSLESVKALAAVRGKEIGVEYAEAFRVLRTEI